MDHRTRMFKALAALVVSMTAAASLLAWLEPRRDSAFFSRSPERIEAFVRSAVATAAPLAPGEWRGVEIIVSGSSDDWRRHALTALRPDEKYHFRVLAGGEVEPSADWRAQRFSPTAGAVRVVVDGCDEGGEIPAPQWLSLRTLIRELHSQAGGAAGAAFDSWSIILKDDGHAAAPGLRARLHQAGLIG